MAVEPRVFDLIAYLVQERARVVSKDEILDAVWAGRIVSESTLTSRINAARRALGDSGEAQSLIRTVPRKGFRFVGEVDDPATPSAPPSPGAQATFPHAPRVTFCRSADGVNIAISTCGDGPPLVKVGTWLTHVEHDWHTSVWGPLYRHLAERFKLVHYDPRGCGLSDQEPQNMSFEGFVHDLEAVVDAAGLEQFALLCFSQGASVGIAYAVRHPERVSRVVVAGGFPLGWRKRGSAAEIATREAMMTLIRHGWGQDNPAFRQVFTTRFWPDLRPEHIEAFDALQRYSATPEGAVRIQDVTGDSDVTGLLPQVTVPTLVIHSRDDGAVPREMGLLMARGIPGARFVEMQTRNHTPMPHEPEWPRYLDEICSFAGAR